MERANAQDVYALLNQLGIPFGNCRRPFGEPTQEQKHLIAKEIIPYITAL